MRPAGSSAFGLSAAWQGCRLLLAWRQAAASEAVFEAMGPRGKRLVTHLTHQGGASSTNSSGQSWP